MEFEAVGYAEVASGRGRGWASLWRMAMIAGSDGGRRRYDETHYRSRVRPISRRVYSREPIRAHGEASSRQTARLLATKLECEAVGRPLLHLVGPPLGRT